MGLIQAAQYEMTDFQRLVHTTPAHVSRFLGGGRGSAKSEATAQDIATVCEEYGKEASVLLVRPVPYESLTDVEKTLEKIFDLVWGRDTHGLTTNSKRGWVWKVPTGSFVKLGVLEAGTGADRYYTRRYQGRNFTHIYVQEAQEFALPGVVDKLNSNLRHPSIPCRMTIEANPGGVGHQWLAHRYVINRKPWQTFNIERKVIEADGSERLSSSPWITCPSTYKDNPYLPDDYLDKLAQACQNDEALFAAWRSGDWTIARGAYFASVLENEHIKINWPVPENWAGWEARDFRLYLSHDHGTAKPAVCYVMAKSPGAIGPDGRFYPAESILMLDEYACHRPTDLSTAFGWPVPQIAGELRALAHTWHIPARGVADDACFGDHGQSSGTIADEYSREGVVFRPAKKGRRAARFAKMKRMLAAAGDFERPGLYVSERCAYWWATVPFLVHDPKDPEVVLKGPTDHGLDASSMGLEGYSALGGVVEGFR